LTQSREDLIPRLNELYQTIDSAYTEVINEIGFSCVGCDGVKCCTIDLNLHTYIERFYLRRGFNSLDDATKQTISARSREIVEAKRLDPMGDAYRNSVCVLNFGGQCGLYEFRPMICRLAGIPHQIARPDGRIVESGGCSRFKETIDPSSSELKLDRTEFYREMASIEINIIRVTGRRASTLSVGEVLSAVESDDDF
jgi:Fe-S-cluster containining protein